MNNLSIIIGREYATRVKKKGFIITTLLMPFVFAAMMLLPVALASIDSGPKPVTVIDKTGQLMKPLAESGLQPVFTDEPVDSALANEDYSSILVIGENAVDDPSDITLYSREAESVEANMLLTNALKEGIENIRLSRIGQENVRRILAEVEADVQINTLSLKDDGNTESSNAALSFAIGMAMSFVLYMFILMYGQMVMTSIIEEKNNRVLELLVTSVKPAQLMMGKLIGVGMVAVTQLLIWLAVILILVQFVLPAVARPEVFEAIAQMGLTAELLRIFAFLLVFLIGGFLIYASIFVAIGAAVDNIQDASQLTSFAVVPIVIALMLSLSVANNPNSEIATIFSLIPFTSPMVMMTRIPGGVPAWELVASIALLFATIYFMVWLSAKIYRVGIFMYGKKPTVKELIRWTRYK